MISENPPRLSFGWGMRGCKQDGLIEWNQVCRLKHEEELELMMVYGE